MTDMLAMSDIRILVDELFAYGQDPDMLPLMQEYDEHLINRVDFKRFLDLYAKRHSVDDYLKIIHTNGVSTKGARYDRVDVLKVLDYPEIKKSIEKKFARKTCPGPFGPVPKRIYARYLEKVIDDGRIDMEQWIAKTGMTERQLKLLSVPDEILIEAEAQTEQEIMALQEKLAELKSEHKDIKSELADRGL